MTRNHMILGVALVIQLGLVALTWSTRGASPRSDAQPLLPDVELSAVQRLSISAPANKAGAPPKTTTIARKGDGWVLPDADDYPADPKKVEAIVSKLLAGRVRAPIANNAANHNALEVGDRAWTRKVDVAWSGGEAKLVVGSARGTSAHVRRADQAEVYLARGFSAASLEQEAASYIETTWLDVDGPDQIVVKNARGTLTLNRVDGVWQLEELPKGETPDPERFTAFVGQASKLVIHSPVGKSVKDEYGLDTPLSAVVTIKKGDKSWRYRLGNLVDGNRYLKRDDNDWVVRIPTFSVSNLMDQTPMNFIKEDRPAAPPGGPGGPGGMPNLPPGLKIPGMPGMQ